MVATEVLVRQAYCLLADCCYYRLGSKYLVCASGCLYSGFLSGWLTAVPICKLHNVRLAAMGPALTKLVSSLFVMLMSISVKFHITFCCRWPCNLSSVAVGAQLCISSYIVCRSTVLLMECRDRGTWQAIQAVTATQCGCCGFDVWSSTVEL